MTAPALMVAATGTGSGKTLISAALLRAWTRQGKTVQPFKTGPDFIDPGFLAAAARRPCPNLDPWAMDPARIAAIIQAHAGDADALLIEGVMGLFDGAADGSGRNADLARALDIPVLLLANGKGRGGSIAALVHGFTSLEPDLKFAGIAVNRTAGPRHDRILRAALKDMPQPLLGLLPGVAGLSVPSRHLGLAQAHEREDLDGMLDLAADWVAENLDLNALWRALAVPKLAAPAPAPPVRPLGQRMAVAGDAAFSFLYAHLLEGWRNAGAEISFFAPLDDQAPPADCDAVYLPGGYPELHAGRLAAAQGFLSGLTAAAARGAVLHGECGGYMVLGRAIIDKAGDRFPMAGLLPLVCSFEDARPHLGYRRATLIADHALGRAGQMFNGHEFHYARVIEEGPADPLFSCVDAWNETASGGGLRAGSVSGSFVHVICGEQA